MNDVLAIIVPAMSTIMTGVIVLGIRWLWTRVRKFLAEGRNELVEYMQRIETQTTATNGRVTKLERDQTVAMERLAHVEGSVETMQRMQSGKPPL